jgi:hypothetical protein
LFALSKFNASSFSKISSSDRSLFHRAQVYRKNQVKVTLEVTVTWLQKAADEPLCLVRFDVPARLSDPTCSSIYECE